MKLLKPVTRHIISIGLFVLVLVFGAIWLLYQYSDHQILTLRYLFVGVFTALPCGMYFVFIALRKSSLLQEYISNLHRLGLLSVSNTRSENTDDSAKPSPTPEEIYFHQARILGYIKSFEGVYGPVSPDVIREILVYSGASTRKAPLSSTELKLQIEDSTATGQIFSFATALPVIIATLLIALGWLTLLLPLDTQWNDDELLNVFKLIQNPVAFGFLGAYFFTIQMLYRRFITNDLRSRAYVSVSMRIILAVIAAWVVEIALDVTATDSGIDTDSLKWRSACLFTFVAGAFPPVLWRLVRTTIKSFAVWAAIPDLDSRLPVTRLDGLTVWHQARLEEEDVENSFNMANVDIVDLLLNTRISPNRIMDWIDQAILLTSLWPPAASATSDIPELVDFTERRLAVSSSGVYMATRLDQYRDQFDKSTKENGEFANKSDRNALDKQQIASVITAVDSYSNLELIRNWKSFSYSHEFRWKPKSTSDGHLLAVKS